MTKAEFLETLRGRLSPLPQAEISKSADYYAEMLDDLTDDGMSEEDAVRSLGSMDDIVERIMYDTPLQTLVKAKVRERRQRSASPILIILAVLGFPLWFPLALTLLAVALVIYLVVWSIVAAAFAVVLALVLGAVGCVVGAAALLIPNPLLLLLAVAAGLVLMGTAILAFFVALAVTRGIVWLTGLFARGVKSLFIGKEAAK